MADNTEAKPGPKPTPVGNEYLDMLKRATWIARMLGWDENTTEYFAADHATTRKTHTATVSTERGSRPNLFVALLLAVFPGGGGALKAWGESTAKIKTSEGILKNQEALLRKFEKQIEENQAKAKAEAEEKAKAEDKPQAQRDQSPPLVFQPIGGSKAGAAPLVSQPIGGSKTGATCRGAGGDQLKTEMANKTTVVDSPAAVAADTNAPPNPTAKRKTNARPGGELAKRWTPSSTL